MCPSPDLEGWWNEGKFILKTQILKAYEEKFIVKNIVFKKCHSKMKEQPEIDIKPSVLSCFSCRKRLENTIFLVQKVSLCVH